MSVHFSFRLRQSFLPTIGKFNDYLLKNTTFYKKMQLLLPNGKITCDLIAKKIANDLF